MSNGTTVMPNGTDIIEETNADGENVVKFNPIFPTLTGSVMVPTIDTQAMANALQDMAIKQGDNYEGGWTSYFNQADLREVPGIQELVNAIIGVCDVFAKELKFPVTHEQSVVALWGSVIKPGGTHGIHAHALSIFSGTFYIKCDSTSAPLVMMNPTRHFRHHELRPLKMEDVGPFTSESMFIQPKQGELHVWPSWLEHHVAQHKGEQNRIAISFNVDYTTPVRK